MAKEKADSCTKAEISAGVAHDSRTMTADRGSYMHRAMYSDLHLVFNGKKLKVESVQFRIK